jgi:Flp pilus assembly protein TadG
MTTRVVLLNRRRRQSGQSFVEFGLAATVFFVIILGIMNMAYGVFCYDTISTAAREAVRYGVVRGPNSAAPATTAEIQQAAVKAAIGVNLAAANVAVSWPADARITGQRDLKVTVTFPYTFFMGTSALTLSSTSQMLASQ